MTELGLAALDDILDRGDLDDWKPLLAEIRRAPWGALAENVLHLVERHSMYGTSSLLQSWIAEQRTGQSLPAVGSGLRELRRRHGVTQQQIGARLGMTQPEVSKLERRRDIRLSTARAFVQALGGRLVLVARFGDREEPLG